MRKTTSVLIVMALILAAFSIPAEAKKKKKKKKKPVAVVEVVRTERVVEVAYASPGIGVAGGPSGRSAGYPVNFPEVTEIPTMPEEKYMKIEVIDGSGQAVAGFISQGDLDGNGLNDDGYGEFCGAHAAPVEVAAPGTPLLGIYAYNGACPDGTPSIMTSGTIKITFSNLP